MGISVCYNPIYFSLRLPEKESLMSHADPTRDELYEVLRQTGWEATAEDYEVEEALYWFAHDWHGGQESNLYVVLCNSQFTPSRLATGPDEDSNAVVMLNDLQNHFFPVDLQSNLECM
jgi:hypothetical protein